MLKNEASANGLKRDGALKNGLRHLQRQRVLPCDRGYTCVRICLSDSSWLVSIYKESKNSRKNDSKHVARVHSIIKN